MRDRGLEEFSLVDVTSFSKDGTERTVHGYRAIRYEIPPGCAAGYMPELNVLCGIADFSTQSEQPVTKHLVVEVTPSRGNGPSTDALAARRRSGAASRTLPEFPARAQPTDS